MADVHKPEVRSYNMSMISGKETKPEMLVRRYLHSKGFRYLLHDKRLPGKPDIVLPKHKTVIFVNGCFWHGHENCKYYKIPATRAEWWTAKIVHNKKSDQANCEKLKELGWKVITIFECKLKRKLQSQTLNELISNIY